MIGKTESHLLKNNIIKIDTYNWYGKIVVISIPECKLDHEVLVY